VCTWITRVQKKERSQTGKETDGHVEKTRMMNWEIQSHSQIILIDIILGMLRWKNFQGIEIEVIFQSG
jgi:hypothetical protein